MKIKLFVTLICLGNLLFAHRVHEITYTFDFDAQPKTLIVHFTQKGAIDLMFQRFPELKEEGIVNLKENITEFETYFNEHINLKIGEENIYFKSIDENLNAHDATITFNLKPEIRYPTSIEIENTSFLEIYHKAKNFIVVKNNGQLYKTILNKSKTKDRLAVSGTPTPQNFEQEKSCNCIWLWILGGVGVIVVVGLIIFLFRIKAKG